MRVIRGAGLSIWDLGLRIADLRNPVDFINNEISERVPRILSVQSIQSEIERLETNSNDLELTLMLHCKITCTVDNNH